MGLSQTCHRRHGEVGIVEFGLYHALRQSTQLLLPQAAEIFYNHKILTKISRDGTQNRSTADPTAIPAKGNCSTVNNVLSVSTNTGMSNSTHQMQQLELDAIH